MATETLFIDGVTFTITGLSGAYTNVDEDPHAAETETVIGLLESSGLLSAGRANEILEVT